MRRKFAQNKIENHSHNDYGGTLQVLSKEELYPYHEPKIEERHNKKKSKHHRFSVLHTRGESNVVQGH